MRIGKRNRAVTCCPVVTHYFFKSIKDAVFFSSKHHPAVIQVKSNMLLQGFHDNRWFHLCYKIALVVASAAEVTALGNLDTLFSNGDPVLCQCCIEIHPPLRIKADIMFFSSRFA